MGAWLGTKRRVPKRGGQDETRAAQLVAAEKAMKMANEKTNEEFIKEYVQPDNISWPTWTHPKTQTKYTISLNSPEKMSEGDLEACYDLVNLTSGDDYRRMSVGWHPEAKRKEMRSPGLRYILVKLGSSTPRAKGDDDDDDDDGADQTSDEGGKDEIRAFTSFMPTFEDNQPVIYCYEIHLMQDMEKTGLGRLLMNHVMSVADSIPALEKTMLTCFVCNEHARRFYENMGFATDESSPQTRRLRGGKTIEPEYVIMARRTRRNTDADADTKRPKITE